MPRDKFDKVLPLALASPTVLGSVEAEIASHDHALLAERSLSSRSRELLRLDADRRAKLRVNLSRLAFMHFDLTALGSLELHPTSFDFLQHELAGRFPGITHGPDFLMVSYYVEPAATDSVDVAEVVAEDIAHVLALGAQSVTKVHVVTRGGAPLGPQLSVVE